MKKNLLVISILIVLGLVAVLYRAIFAPATAPPNATSLIPPLPQSPLDATYRIDDREVTLTNGVSQTPAAPGSATLTEVRIWGEPVIGDIDGDGLDDAAFILTEESGGSGTFFYITAAIAQNDGGYLGLNAVFLGDRVAMKDISIADEIIVVNYAERTLEQSFAEAPSEAVTARITLVGYELRRHDGVGEGAQILSGELVYGHESRTFRACNGDTYWIAPASPSRAALEAIYQQATRNQEPYSSVYMVVMATVGDRIDEGFAAAYDHSIVITSILSAPRGGSCAASTTP